MFFYLVVRLVTFYLRVFGFYREDDILWRFIERVVLLEVVSCRILEYSFTTRMDYGIE